MITKVYDNVSTTLEIPKSILPENGTPFSHHFQSTTSDNLIELAGRICYDSCKSENTRSSAEYHKHINDVGHGSVQEHSVFTMQLKYSNPVHIADHNALALLACANRPGVWTTEIDRNVRITANVRSIIEWNQWHNNIVDPSLQEDIGNLFRELIRHKIPLAIAHQPVKMADRFTGELVTPNLPEEKWYSFYINNVSRGLTHELVRHKYHTAISQRSTRYVDESSSEWIWHPLIQKYQSSADFPTFHYYENNQFRLHGIKELCQNSYDTLVAYLEKKLIVDGIDKFTAKKQSRGSARGILGNALATELIFSASLDQVAEIINQRGSSGADGEIRILASQLFEIIEPELRAAGYNYSVSDSPDKIGKVVSHV